MQLSFGDAEEMGKRRADPSRDLPSQAGADDDGVGAAGRARAALSEFRKPRPVLLKRNDAARALDAAVVRAV